MRAHGSDRLAEGADETFLLSCRLPKGWTARVPKTLIRTEFPGTAVLWDDIAYEVVAVEPLPNGVRYTLAPWPDMHTIRLSERYDDATEERRVVEWRAAHARERHRLAANLLAPLTGHLPAIVQEHLASEVGIVPNRLTLLSCLAEIVALAFAMMTIAQAVMDNRSTPWLAIAGVLFGMDALVRLWFVMSQGRPIGSPAGLLVYGIWFALFDRQRGAPSPLRHAKGHGVRFLPPPEDVAARDAFHVREPLITLLTPAEQERAAERFGYDFRRSAPTVAGLILAFAVLGVITSIRTLAWGVSISALSSLLVAAALAVEQVVRLAALRREPAGSILAPLACPFVRRYTA